MVSRNSPQNPTSAMLHQFIISDQLSGQTQFESQHFDDGYGSVLRGNQTNTNFPQSLIPSIHALGERMSRAMDLLPVPIPPEERQMMDLLGAGNESSSHQRLSLSLGSRRFLNSEILSPNYFAGQNREVFSDDYNFKASTSTNQSFSDSISNSRYLRPTQCLLEEIVSVGGGDLEQNSPGKLFPGRNRGGFGLSSELKAEFCSNEMLLPDKQDLQIKMAKLISLLEEVEERYEKYWHQMEELVSSFESMAGLGAARCYTASALQAMSRHFGNLRDAIVAQINITRGKFNHDFPKISTRMSQLGLFDRENRNNRFSLQQLGLIQSHRQAWRPIRGLPETSVAILRSWLFEHFLHPYPTDSEKLMLSSQTGLSKNQVSNWFINARVRLWKPMIEEMYKEEFGDCSKDNDDPSMSSNSFGREGDPEPDED